MSFFSDFRYLNLMTSSAAILNFRMRHSHGRNFCPILFKFWSDVAMGNPMFAIENQQNRWVTSGSCSKKKVPVKLAEGQLFLTFGKQ